MEDNDKALQEAKLLISQHEAKLKSQQEHVKELETKKREMEEKVDWLNDEVGKLKAAEEMHSKEKQKGNANQATLAVARKLVAYLMAVDRGQRDFVPAELRIGAAA